MIFLWMQCFRNVSFIHNSTSEKRCWKKEAGADIECQVLLTWRWKYVWWVYIKKMELSKLYYLWCIKRFEALETCLFFSVRSQSKSQHVKYIRNIRHQKRKHNVESMRKTKPYTRSGAGGQLRLLIRSWCCLTLGNYRRDHLTFSLSNFLCLAEFSMYGFIFLTKSLLCDLMPKFHWLVLANMLTAYLSG